MLGLLGLSLSAGAAEYWVDNVAGDDDGTGSKSKPFRTFDRAVKALAHGDKVHLVANKEPYRQTLRIAVSGAKDKPIVLVGHGAVITGLDPIDNAAFTIVRAGVFKASLANRRGKPVIAGRALATRQSPDALTEWSHCWVDDELHVRVPADLDFASAKKASIARDNGVEINGASHWEIRDLTAEWVGNDAFNIHGKLTGLHFVNIEGRHCLGGTSQGFSAHDRCTGILVESSRFHHNSMGIVDVHQSQTEYRDCLVYENSGLGVSLHGANHTMTGCTIRNNGTVNLEVTLDTDKPAPDQTVRVSIAGCRIGPGGQVALRVAIPAGKGKFTLIDSVVGGAKKFDVVVDGGVYAGDGNIFSPGRFSFDGGKSVSSLAVIQKRFSAEQNSAAVKDWPATQPENTSRLAEPSP